MLRLNTATLNLLARIKEKIREAVPLSPDEMQLRDWLRRMKHRAERLAHYRSRNAGYPYSSTRQNTRIARQELHRKLRAFNKVLRQPDYAIAFRIPGSTRDSITAQRAVLHARYWSLGGRAVPA